jgi:hypothetical protein
MTNPASETTVERTRVKKSTLSARPRIALLDQRRQVFGPPIEALAAALQKQVSRDFAPQWGRDARILAIPRGHDPPEGSWWLVILDYAGRGALGYHFVTAEGLPQAVVGAVSSGERWPVVASHELLEMLSNPLLNVCIYNPKLNRNIPREVCDPCEADAYHINPANSESIQVANFVYPTWFRSNAYGLKNKDGGPFDHMRRIHAPFDVSPTGGWINPSGCPQAGKSVTQHMRKVPRQKEIPAGKRRTR